MGKTGLLLSTACWALISGIVTLHAASVVHEPASPAKTVAKPKPVNSASELNGGYYLLYHLADEESSVPMLFIVKDAPGEVGAYSKQVGRVADDTKASLEQMAQPDPSLHLDKDPLPQIENDVRASIRDEKEQQLVYDTSGSEFIRVFLNTQIQASTYALNLCKVLAEKETNPRRAKALQNLAAEWRKVRENAFRILRNY